MWQPVLVGVTAGTGCFILFYKEIENKGLFLIFWYWGYQFPLESLV
jgi:hypothetical protein